MSLNHITVMGRLTKDPELRYTQTQTPVANFTLAVDRDFSDEKKTDFIPVIAWKKSAEFVEKYFFKGDMAIVTGRLQMREWTDKQGQNRTSAEVVAEHIYFGQSKQRADNGTRGRTTVTPTDVSAADWDDLDDDGDLPF